MKWSFCSVFFPPIFCQQYSHSSFSTITRRHRSLAVFPLWLVVSLPGYYIILIYSFSVLLLVAKPLIVLPRYSMTDGGEFRLTLKKLWSKWSVHWTLAKSVLSFRYPVKKRNLLISSKVLIITQAATKMLDLESIRIWPTVTCHVHLSLSFIRLHRDTRAKAGSIISSTWNCKPSRLLSLLSIISV